jgi:hypothetical protein
MIELGSPIVALIQHHIARGRLRVSRLLGRYIEVKGHSANDSMNMGAYFTREDDRITLLDR